MKNPLEKIKRTMFMEVLVGLMACLLIIAVNKDSTFSSSALTIMLVFALAMVAMFIGYGVLIYRFLRTTSRLDLSVKESLQKFIHDFQRGIRLYKVFNIALLPLGIVGGIASSGGGFFDRLVEGFQMGSLTTGNYLFLIFNVLLFLLLAVLIDWYVNRTYQRYLDQLESEIEEFYLN
ncbi:MAG: hypothetical protein JJ975_07935 [Bacteroidia bacterium]|nr:hypothetical protein [Bacteroidia bacterium]